MKRTIYSLLFLAFIASCQLNTQSEAKVDGTLIVLNKSEASASIISLQTNKVVSTIETGIGPHEVAVSFDGQSCVVTNYGIQDHISASLTLIDLADLKPIKTIDLGDHQKPHGILYIDENRLLVTSQVQKALLVVNIEEGEIEHVFETDQELSHMVTYSPRHQLAFVSNIGSGSITVFDIAEKRRVKIIETGEGAEGIELTNDENEVWITNRAEDKISILDTKTLEITETFQCASFPIRVKFTPDGKYALISNARSAEVVVFDVETRKELKRIEMKFKAIEEKENRLFSDRFGDSPVPIGILIHPNGRQAYVANTNADIVTVIDLEKFEIVNRLIPGKEPDGLGFTMLEF